MYNLIAGIGPFRLNEKGDLTFQNHTLNLITDLLFIEQQLGTNGFSPCTEESDLPNSEDNYVDNLHYFLHEFYKIHNNYNQVNTYFVGESYAGHLIPKLVKKIYTSSDQKKIKIGGIMFLAPLVSPKAQFSSYSKYIAWKLKPTFKEYMQIVGNDLSTLILSGARKFLMALSFFVRTYFLSAQENKRNFTIFNIKQNCLNLPCTSMD